MLDQGLLLMGQLTNVLKETFGKYRVVPIQHNGPETNNGRRLVYLESGIYLPSPSKSDEMIPARIMDREGEYSSNVYAVLYPGKHDITMESDIFYRKDYLVSITNGFLFSPSFVSAKDVLKQMIRGLRIVAKQGISGLDCDCPKLDQRVCMLPSYSVQRAMGLDVRVRPVDRV